MFLKLAIFLLAFFGDTDFGASPEQIDGRYVYLATEWSKPRPEFMVSGPDEYYAFACSARFKFNVYQAAIQDYFCGDLPSETMIIYAGGWSDFSTRLLYLSRHEFEHFLRGPDGPPEDIWNESAARAAGCAVSWDSGYCGEEENP